MWHRDTSLREQRLVDEDAVGQLVHRHGVAFAIPLAFLQGDRNDVGGPLVGDVLVQWQ